MNEELEAWAKTNGIDNLEKEEYGGNHLDLFPDTIEGEL